MHIHFESTYFKARGIKKDSVPDMIEIELTNIPVKSGIVYLIFSSLALMDVGKTSRRSAVNIVSRHISRAIGL